MANQIINTEVTRSENKAKLPEERQIATSDALEIAFHIHHFFKLWFNFQKVIKIIQEAFLTLGADQSESNQIGKGFNNVELIKLLNVTASQNFPVSYQILSIFVTVRFT